MITGYSNTISVTTLGLLDAYPGAAAAYSVRKLRNAYTGSAIRVRRSSDNAEQDIGFSGGNLDTSALTSFCSGTNGFVTTWYDQSGNARNATQTTAANQPQIVSSGNVLTLNSKTRVNFNAKKLDFSGFGSNNFTIISVIKQISLGNYGSYLQNMNGSYNGYKLVSQQQATFQNSFIRYNGTAESISNSRAKATNSIINSQYLENWIYPNNPPSLYENNASQTVGTSIGGWGSDQVASFGSLGYTGNLTGQFDIQELILYTTNENSNINGINTNINTYYGIY